ncbi:MAG: PqqD family protein [Gemmatimonadaceae bacterium]
MTWSDSQRLPSSAPNVIFKRLPEGAVIYSTSSEIYFGLNDVGARIWELLPPACRTFAEMCQQLGREYPDAPPPLIRRDVTRYLDELLSSGLAVKVEMHDGSVPPGSPRT